MHRTLTGLALAVLLTLAPAAYAAKPQLSARGEMLDRVVAVVNDGMVLQSELDQQLVEIKNRLHAQNVALPADSVLTQQILDRLIQEEIQTQHADKAGLKVSDEQVNMAMEDIAKRNGVSFADLPEKLASEGLDYASYRASLRREIQREMLRERDVLQRITISPRELDAYIDQQKKTVSANNEYNVSHILISVAQDAAPAAVNAARERANDIVARARKGEDFAKLAVSYSASQTALEGGALGWRKGPELPTFLSDVVGRMKPGDIANVMQTPSGFHIVRLNDVRSNASQQLVEQIHLRHILIKTNEIKDDATVRDRLADMRTRVLAGEDFAVLAKATSEDPGSAINGGDLGWTTLDQFVGEFSTVAGNLKDNEISEPFHTPFGWHIVQRLGHRQFDNTETAAREDAFRHLRESRLDEATEVWLQQLRDEAYVNILI